MKLDWEVAVAELEGAEGWVLEHRGVRNRRYIKQLEKILILRCNIITQVIIKNNRR